MGLIRKFICIFVFSTLMLAGCEYLKSSKPIGTLKDYERMLVGRLDANYIGTDNCLSACHFHDDNKNNLRASTMGFQLSAESGMPLVDCESCHGPGSLAVADITPEQVKEDAKSGKQTKCNYETLIDIKNLPAQAKSLMCLKCHTANATFTLHNWNSSMHNISDVSCADCHNIHAGPDLTVRKDEMEDMCEQCHQNVKAEFSLPSHHPIHEKKIFCTGCHAPHGSTSESLLNKSSVKDTCTQCHADKEGPFLYEHAENTEECISCHSAHGSVNNNMLKISTPFLCMQCHISHGPTSDDNKGKYYTRCTDCHTTIHGTDTPSRSGTGRFTY